MSAPAIFVAGACNVDVKAVTTQGTVAGLSTPGEIRVTPGGVARNVAEALALLGRRVVLCTIVGPDAWGDWVVAQTEAAGVEVRVLAGARRTGIYVNVDGRGVADTTVVETVPPRAWLEHVPRRVDLAIVDANPSEAALAALAARVTTLAMIGTSPAKVMRLRPLLPRAWTVCLTTMEGRALVGAGTSDLRGEVLARAVQALGPRWVLLTEGDRGLGLLGERWTAEPAYPGTVVQATGAGDTAAAVVIAGLREGGVPEQILRRAARAAALSVGVWENVHPDVGTVI